MRYLKRVFPLMLVIFCLALAGCGSSSSSTSSDPLAAGAPPAEGTPTGGGIVLSYNLSLSITDMLQTSSSVGAGSDVMAQATLTDSTGQPVANQPIKFEKVDANAPVTITSPIGYTTSSGKALNYLKAGTPASTTDVVIQVSTSVNGQNITAIGVLRILRSKGNVINFLTTKNPITDPDGSLNTVSITVENVDPVDEATKGLVQLVPFEVLDLNGIPRPRVPVKLSIYSVLPLGCNAFIDSPELPAEKTVTTDDNGVGIFNAIVTIPTPPIGSQSSCSIIYKATTDDMLSQSGSLIYSYGGFIATLSNIKPK